MKYQAIREAIKELASGQRELKYHRKTETFEGTRKFTVWEACEKVEYNRYLLRHLYAAYAIIRGKDRPVIKKELKKLEQSRLDSYVKTYTPKEIELKETA